MKTPASLLVRSVNWLGDAVMTTPALMQLRRALPHTRISLLSPAKLADLWLHHPALDDVITLHPRENPWQVGRRLRSRRFDAALVLPNSPRSALECWLAGAKTRVGFARPLRTWLLSHPVAPRPESIPMRKPSAPEIRERLARFTARPNLERLPGTAHHALDYLALAAAFGAEATWLDPVLEVTAAEVESTRAKHGLDLGTQWLALNPGAEYGPAKRWPASRFASVARAIAQSIDCRWMILGGPGDRPLAAEIAAAVPGSVDLAGRTTLRELLAVLRIARVMLTNDTGPMHVAAALGTPLVVPFGSTSPELTGPGRPGDPRHRLILTQAACAPCFLRECPIDFRCMLGISEESVAQAVREVLAAQSH
ncbi:MAG: lipopolysaccharide heptosyltransferase II [Verrucomicrobiales bacterium]|nr:lipopolysaccharide heptosyltransferase II [Verrucomicrobiales bacterium]